MNKKNIFKMVLLIIAAFILSLFFEYGVFNLHSITNDKIELEYNLQDKEKNKEISIKRDDSMATVSIVFPKAVYISDFQMDCDVKKDTTYSMIVEYETSFGALQKLDIKDDAYTALNKCYTGIHKKVKSIDLHYNIDNIPEITKITVRNKASFCYERLFLSFSIAFIILAILIYRKNIFKKLEYFFLMVSVLLGVSMILIVGLNKEGWDEAIHFSRIYSYSFMEDVKWNEAVVESEIMHYNTVEERDLVKRYYNKVYKNGKQSSESKDLYVPYNMRGYLFQSAMIFVARHLNFSFYRLYLFGKLGNLILYVICIFIAIRIAKKGKLPIAVLGMLPTPLFLAASYTYDASLIAITVLAFTIWMNEMIDKDKNLSNVSLVLMVLLFIYGCSSKAVYIPLLLLLLLLPGTKFNNKKQMYFVKAMVVVLFLFVMASFVMPVTSNTVAGNVAYGGDTRGGDTGSVRQMKSILYSPFSYIALFFKSLVSLENFGVFGNDPGLITSLEFFTFSNIGTMNDKFVFLLLPMFMLMSFINVEGNDNFMLNTVQKVGMVIILLMITGMIWTALYLDFTEIGMEHIYGVQARYYIPLTLPIIYLVTNKRLQLNVTYDSIKKLFSLITLFILGYGVYFDLFLNVFSY